MKIKLVLLKDGEVLTRIYAFNNNLQNSDNANLEVNYPVSGAPYAMAPSTPDPTSENLNSRVYFNSGNRDILTRDWIPRDTRIVHTTGDENIDGWKTFLDSIHVKVVNPYLIFVETDTTKGSGSTGTAYQGIYFSDKNQSTTTDVDTKYLLGAIINGQTSGSHNTIRFLVYTPTANSTNYTGFRFGYDGGVTNSNIYLYPASDNTIKLGSGSYRWSTIYAGTGTINTSDKRLKTNIKNIPDNILDIWDQINFTQFQFKDMVKEKGDKARIHSGAIAQDIQKVFSDNNLNIFDYSFFCHDEWTAKPEIKDKNGNIVEESREAGDRYSLRYEELLCIEAAYQRRKNKQLEQEIQSLKEDIRLLKEAVFNKQ